MNKKILYTLVLSSQLVFTPTYAIESSLRFSPDSYSSNGDEFPASIELLKFNSNKQDFSPCYYGDKIVFTSERRRFNSIKRKDLNRRPYYDVYIADIDQGDLTNIDKFKGVNNKKFHEGPVSFNSEGNMMFFTQNSYKEKSSTKEVNLQIRYANLKDNTWNLMESPSFNSPDYSCGHPAISPDGKWLYFVSDMPGGIGGTDIYRAEIKSDGNTGAPINLGSDINSEKNEMFPFVHKDGMLIFASNKQGGLGGLDIYVSQITETLAIGKIIHPGAPFNGESDDFSLILDENQSTGFFTSDRTGKGSDDIYSVKMLSPFIFGVELKGQSKDQDGNILANTLITLKDDKGNVIETFQTNENGQYKLTLEEDQNYSLEASKEDYFNVSKDLNTASDEKSIKADLVLEKDPGLSLSAKFTDQDGKLLDDVQAKIINNLTGTSEDFITSTENMVYFKPLEGLKIGDRISFNFELSKEGYLSKTVTFNKQLTEPGIIEIPLKELSLEKIEVGADLSKIIEIAPIYFDLGKYNIRPDAAAELDKIVKVMNENPNMIVELGSHTDSRGSSSSNKRLSYKRAKLSAKYIADRITNPERISGKGYGESKLINACSDGVRCSEEEHQLNRRTEFIIIKM